MIILEFLVVWFLLTLTVMVIVAWVGLLLSIILHEWIYVPLDELPSLVLFGLVAVLPIAILITLRG
jgi:hypothetical protein